MASMIGAEALTLLPALFNLRGLKLHGRPERPLMEVESIPRVDQATLLGQLNVA